MKKIYKGSMCLIIIILVLVGLIAAGLGVYYLYSSGKIKLSRSPSDLSKSDLFKTTKEVREIMATVVPTQAADFVKDGDLRPRGEGSENESWILLYGEPGNPAATVLLDFNFRSMCDFGSGEGICNTKKFNLGMRVHVEGQRNGNLLKVIKLKVIE